MPPTTHANVRLPAGFGSRQGTAAPAAVGPKSRVLLRPDLCLFAFTILLFSLCPEIDTTVSGLFFDPARGTFIGRDLAWAVQIYRYVPMISWTLLAALLIMFLLASRSPDRPRRRALQSLFLLLVMMGGPGLVATAFKDHWHRARPIHLEMFGGKSQFTPALEPATQCGTNCSFISGHASIGFFFMAPAWLFPRRRRMLLGTGVTSGLLVGAARVVQGAHFVSDVLFSGWAIYWLCELLARLIEPAPDGDGAGR